MRELKNYKSGGKHDVDTSAPDLSKYDGMSHNQLVAELMRAVASAKSDGSFSQDRIDDFVNFISPELDEASRARLKELVGMIKGG